MKTIVFDLDGTLADCSHRLHFAKNKQWNEFFRHVDGDIPIRNNVEVYRIFAEQQEEDYELIIVSGRSAQCREATERWLLVNLIVYDHLYMRKENDHRPDYLVKMDIYKEHLKNKDILCIFDDRNQVVNMWRSLGLTCYQVAEGNF